MNLSVAEIWLLAMSAVIAAALLLASISEARSRRERATYCKHCTQTAARLRNAGLPAQRTYQPGDTR